MNRKKLTLVTDKPETMHSPVALTFDAEIKRMSVDKDLPIRDVMAKLAGFTGISEKQLYNYRSGATDIPSLLIPIFCKQFESNALAMAVVGLCDVGDFEPGDGLDLVTFAAKTVQEQLAGQHVFLEAVKDGKIDGHELMRIKNVNAMIVRNAHRTIEVAERMRKRRVA